MIQIPASPTTIARLGEWAKNGRLSLKDSKPGCIAVELDVLMLLGGIAKKNNSTLEEALIFALDNAQPPDTTTIP